MGLRVDLEIEIESSGDMWMEERYWFASHFDQSYFEIWTVFRLFITCGWRRIMGLRVILRSRLSLEVSHDMWMEESYWFASKSFRSELFQKFRLSSDDS